MVKPEAIRSIATCCNCCGLLFALVAWTSFAWMWGFTSTNIEINGVELRAPIFAGGPIASAITRTVFLDENTTIPRQVILWNELQNLGACEANSEIYSQWSSRYGFCKDGVFQIPAEVTRAEAFSIASVILLLTSVGLSVWSWAKERVGSVCLPFVVNVSAFITVVGFVATISLSPWVSDLITANGGVVPFVNSQGVLVPLTARLRYGTSFFAYCVLIVILIAINVMRVFLYCRYGNQAVVDGGVKFPESDKYGDRDEDVIYGPRALATV